MHSPNNKLSPSGKQSLAIINQTHSHSFPTGVINIDTLMKVSYCQELYKIHILNSNQEEEHKARCQFISR